MERTSFTSAGKRIGVAAFPAAPANIPGAGAPAILLLHGAGGVDGGNQTVGALAAAAAIAGFSAFVVEYFDRMGTSNASDAMIYEHFLAWLETLGEAVDFIAQYPGADAARIGVFGYSLGGYLGVALAAQDARVRALVELAGGIDADFARQFQRLPPLLIVHGEDDQRVPFARGVELERFARDLGGVVETEYLAREGHLLSPLAALRTWTRTVEFFQQQLT